MAKFINDLDVFYDPSQQLAFAPAFDEGPVVSIPASQRSFNVSLTTPTTFSGSTDTSAIDAFTQGVELTTLGRYSAGIAKIWSGEPGHQFPVTWYGERGPSISDTFSDDEAAYLIDASSIIKNKHARFPVLLFPIQSASETSTAAYIPTYKTKQSKRTNRSTILYRTTQDINAVTMNGVIEPLTVRTQPSFYSSTVPSDVHQVLGAVGVGNVDSSQASDQVLTVDYYDVKSSQVPFVDEGQSVNLYEFSTAVVNGVSVVTSASFHRVINEPSIAHVNDEAKIKAFHDARYVRNVPAVNSEGANIVRALSLMTGSTANYVSFEQRSSTCGWGYDNNTAIGTDSLSFGGMTY